MQNAAEPQPEIYFAVFHGSEKLTKEMRQEVLAFVNYLGKTAP